MTANVSLRPAGTVRGIIALLGILACLSFGLGAQEEESPATPKTFLASINVSAPVANWLSGSGYTVIASRFEAAVHENLAILVPVQVQWNNSAPDTFLGLGLAWYPMGMYEGLCFLFQPLSSVCVTDLPAEGSIPWNLEYDVGVMARIGDFLTLDLSGGIEHVHVLAGEFAISPRLELSLGLVF